MRDKWNKYILVARCWQRDRDEGREKAMVYLLKLQKDASSQGFKD